MNTYENITHEIVSRLYITVEPFLRQKKGSCADYLINDSYCLEVKLDFSAANTGNIFIETATKNGNKVTESGVALSAKYDYSMLYLIPLAEKFYSCFEIEAKKLVYLAKKFGRRTQTRPRVNGNFPGFFGIGYILKIEILKENAHGQSELTLG